MLGQFLTLFFALFSLIIILSNWSFNIYKHSDISINLLLSLIKAILPTSFCLQSFSELPRNTSLKQGEDVMLKCVVKAQRGLFYKPAFLARIRSK